MRNRIAEILLWLSWPVCLLNRAWNNHPSYSASWIIFDRSVRQDFRWYIVYNQLWLSATLVIMAILICTRLTFRIRIVSLSLLIVSFIDIVHYWLFFRRNEWFLFGEGVIMAVAAIIRFYAKYAKSTINEKAA